MNNLVQAVRAGLKDPERRVRVGLLHSLRGLRPVLRALEGGTESAVTGLLSALRSLMGTPRDPMDWGDPEAWIAERLEGDHREIARAVWEESKGSVNPRYLRGHVEMIQRYRLLETDTRGALRLTTHGRDFLDSPRGAVERELDEQEGMLEALGMVADLGPAQIGKLVPSWAEYLERRSRYRTDGTIRDTLRRRLRCLVAREFVERDGNLYRITESGLTYLEGSEMDDDASLDHQLRLLLRRQVDSVRARLRDLLLEMDPLHFEHLVKRLLEEMGYEDVEVTAPSGDGGVDVVGSLELGITAVREVVQVKRHRKTIQRRTLDELRGSLHRFDAVRGTVVTTSKFSKGAKEEAISRGAAPITLIDGERLVDLLIEHGLGVRKRTVELLELDAEELELDLHRSLGADSFQDPG